MRKLKYPIGCFILWCNEYYKVLENYSDYSAKVVDMGGDIITNFDFEYGEQAQLVTDSEKIEELKRITNSFKIS